MHVGNTDAEGRMVLADLLSHLRELAKTVPHPHLFTCATLYVINAPNAHPLAYLHLHVYTHFPCNTHVIYIEIFC